MRSILIAIIMLAGFALAVLTRGRTRNPLATFMHFATLHGRRHAMSARLCSKMFAKIRSALGRMDRSGLRAPRSTRRRATPISKRSTLTCVRIHFVHGARGGDARDLHRHRRLSRWAVCSWPRGLRRPELRAGSFDLRRELTPRAAVRAIP